MNVTYKYFSANHHIIELIYATAIIIILLLYFYFIFPSVWW